MELTTHEKTDSDVLKVALAGALDIKGAGDVDERLGRIAAERRKVVIDITGVDFVASIGIRVLVQSAKTIAENAGRMAVFGAQPNVAKVLEATGVGPIIHLVATEDEAIAHVDR